MSYMYLDWDIETDTLSSAKQGLGNGVVQAHPTDPNKVLYTSKWESLRKGEGVLC